jgi:hypothetical protein
VYGTVAKFREVLYELQEVDNIHSHIEKAMSLSEIFSPVSLIRVLTNVRKGSM